MDLYFRTYGLFSVLRELVSQWNVNLLFIYLDAVRLLASEETESRLFQSEKIVTNLESLFMN